MGTTAVNRRGPPSLPARAGSPWPGQMDRKMLRFVEKTRNSHRQITTSADGSVVSAWGGIEARRPPLPGARWPSRRSPEAAGSPLSGARETWLAPNVIGAWGVTTLSANLAGDDSWVAGIELATASEPPARRPRIWGRCLGCRPQPPLSCNPLLNHARTLNSRLRTYFFLRRQLGKDY